MNKNVMNLMGIEKFAPKENNFNPVVIYDNWRVAVLNYFDVVEKELLYRLERHTGTDEVFVLQKGEAWLILGEDGKIPAKVETFPMETGTVYNIKKNVWHHIVMTEDASVLIVENADVTCDYEELSQEDVQRLKNEIQWLGGK